jgi:hypothetical protein
LRSMYSAHIARRREAITTVIGSSDAGNASYSDRHRGCALCSSHAASTTQPATATTRRVAPGFNRAITAHRHD